MDPNFVQHDIADISIRFFGYLIFILAYSTGIHGGVRATFQVCRVSLIDTWWDEVAIAALGIFFALSLNLNLFFYVAGLTDDQFVHALPVMAGYGVPAGLLPAWLTIGVCNVVTGAMVVGGRKAIVSVAEEFRHGFDAIKAIMDRKANGAATHPAA